MASRDVVLTGRGKWFQHLFTPESYQQGPPRYHFVFYPDKSSAVLFKELKLRNGVKADADGEYVNLRRDHNPKVWNGAIIKGAEGGPPSVVDAEGTAWDKDKLIGNMSSVSVMLNVYDTKMGPGSRIMKVKITDLIEYNPPVMAEGEALPF